MSLAEIRALLREILATEEKGELTSDILHKYISIVISELQNIEVLVNVHSNIDRRDGV
jgi:hypothetical protein